jgi:hypothetical protein
MNVNNNHWRKLFLFGLGLAAGSAFCMKWMESDLWVNDEKFTIVGLELFYTKEKVMMILRSIDPRVKTILGYHLHFDFAFMAGVYPGIAALCMMARQKLMTVSLKKILFALAILQSAAWVGDIGENLYMLKWKDHPDIGREFSFYHFIVAAKWIIALTGVLFSAAMLLSRKKIK